MAKLPTVRNLSRDIAAVSGNVSTAGAGAGQYLGQALGNVASFTGQVFQQEKQRRDNVEIAEAEADMLIAQGEEQSAFDQDGDYSTYTSRYQEKIGKRFNDISSRITNPEARKLFEIKQKVRIAQGTEKLKDFAWGKEVTSKKGELETRMDALLKNGMNTGDIAGTVNSAQMLLTSYADRGYLNEAEDDAMMLKVKDRLARGRIGSLSPDEALKELDTQAVKDNLDPDVWRSLRKAKEQELKSAQAEERQGEAFGLADQAVDDNWTIGRFMKESRKIKDPATRLAAENRFRSVTSINAAETQRANNKAFEKNYRDMEKGKTFSEFTPAELDSMPASLRNNLKAFEDEKNKARIASSAAAATEAEKDTFESSIRAMEKGKTIADFTDEELDAMPYAFRSKLLAYEESRNSEIEGEASDKEKKQFESYMRQMEKGKSISEFTEQELDSIPFSYRTKLMTFEDKRTADLEAGKEEAATEQEQATFETAMRDMEQGKKLSEFTSAELDAMPYSLRSKLISFDTSRSEKAEKEGEEKDKRGKEIASDWQKVAFESHIRAMEKGKAYSEFTDKELDSLPFSLRSKLQNFEEARTTKVSTPRAENDFSVQTQMNTLLANGEYEEAQTYLYANFMKLKDTQRQSYDVAIKKGMVSPESSREVKSSYTIRQDIARRFGGKDEDPKTQALFLEKYDEWSVKFQNDNERNPTFDEANKFKNGLIFEMKEEGFLWDSWKGKDEVKDIVTTVEKKALTEGLAGINAKLQASGMPAIDISTYSQLRSKKVKGVSKPKAKGAVHPFDAAAARLSTETGLPASVVKRQVGQESGFNPEAKSPTGVKGKFQITIDTAKRYGFGEKVPGSDEYRARSSRPEDETYQQDAYAAIMKDNMKIMSGDIKGALMAYNAGPANAKLIMAGKKPKAITRNGKVVKTADEVEKEAIDYVTKILGG